MLFWSFLSLHLFFLFGIVGRQKVRLRCYTLLYPNLWRSAFNPHLMCNGFISDQFLPPSWFTLNLPNLVLLNSFEILFMSYWSSSAKSISEINKGGLDISYCSRGLRYKVFETSKSHSPYNGVNSIEAGSLIRFKIESDQIMGWTVHHERARMIRSELELLNEFRGFLHFVSSFFHPITW